MTKAQQKYYQRHTEKILEGQRQYRKTEKYKAWAKDYYKKNKKKKLETLAKNRAKWKSQWLSILEDYYGKIKCQECGYDKCFDALDFHHPNGKEKSNNPARLLMKKPTPERIKEILSCQLLCANCHRELHSSKRFNRTFKPNLWSGSS